MFSTNSGRILWTLRFLNVFGFVGIQKSEEQKSLHTGAYFMFPFSNTYKPEFCILHEWIRSLLFGWPLLKMCFTRGTKHLQWGIPIQFCKNNRKVAEGEDNPLRPFALNPVFRPPFFNYAYTLGRIPQWSPFHRVCRIQILRSRFSNELAFAGHNRRCT